MLDPYGDYTSTSWIPKDLKQLKERYPDFIITEEIIDKYFVPDEYNRYLDPNDWKSYCFTKLANVLEQEKINRETEYNNSAYGSLCNKYNIEGLL